jgi:hypothetical protein
MDTLRTTVAKVRAALVSYLEGKAGWRQSVADQIAEHQPWGVGKNENHAESLRRVANYVKGLPDDDLTLRSLADWPDDVLECRLEKIHTDTIHCGRPECPMDHEECPAWFASFAKDVVAEVKEFLEPSSDGYRAGFQAGQEWAKNQADRDQLERLADHVAGAVPESPWWESMDSDGGGLDASDYLAIIVQTGSDDDDDAAAFWKRALGEQAHRICDETFLRGFGEGAVAVWEQVQDKL